MTAVIHRAAPLAMHLAGRRLEGYAAVFDQLTDLGRHLESIAPSAFKLALRGSDVRALVNHNPSALLGRQSVGTLRLSTDSKGLHFSVILPDTQIARDLRALVERGDLTGASFAAVPGLDEWTRSAAGRNLRRHLSFRQLRDVSVVTFPAYPQTSVALRGASPDRRTQLIRARHRAQVPA